MFKSKCPKCSELFFGPKYKYHKDNYKWNELSSGSLRCPHCGIELEEHKYSKIWRYIQGLILLLVFGLSFLHPEHEYYVRESAVFDVFILFLVLEIIFPERYKVANEYLKNKT